VFTKLCNTAFVLTSSLDDWLHLGEPYPRDEGEDNVKGPGSENYFFISFIQVIK